VDDAERIQQWLVDKHALNCPQCRQHMWDFRRVERVALIPLRDLPRDTSAGGPPISRAGGDERAAKRPVEDLLQAARENTATRLVCGHCGNVLLLDDMILEREN
jgi:hypothetical protein